MAGQSAVFTKSRRAGKSASFHIILKYGGAIRFLKNIKEDREIHILSPYFNYGRVIPIKNKQKARFRFFEKVKDGRAIRFFSFLENLGWQEYLHPFTFLLNMARQSAFIHKISMMAGQSTYFS